MYLFKCLVIFNLYQTYNINGKIKEIFNTYLIARSNLSSLYSLADATFTEDTDQTTTDYPSYDRNNSSSNDPSNPFNWLMAHRKQASFVESSIRIIKQSSGWVTEMFVRVVIKSERVVIVPFVPLVCCPLLSAVVTVANYWKFECFSGLKYEDKNNLLSFREITY